MTRQAVRIVVAIAFVVASLGSLELVRPKQDESQGIAASGPGDFSLDLVSPAFAQAAVIISDDFSSSILQNFWSFQSPPGGSYQLSSSGTDAFLELVVPPGDFDPWHQNNAVRMMQAAPDEDFSIEAKFLNDPTQQYQMQGLLIEQDANNWVRFDTHSDGTTQRLFGAVTLNGSSTPLFNTAIAAGGASFLRIVRTGDNWTFEFSSLSSAGTPWATAGSVTQPLTVTAVGPFAGSVGSGGNAGPGYTSQVDYFFNSATPILAPIADAGFSRTAALGETVVLDGSGSLSPGGAELTYSWQLLSAPSGSAAALSDPAAVKPRLDIDLPGQYVAELTVGDGISQSVASSVTINTVNSPPVADAGLDASGADIVSTGSLLALDGSKSWDPDGDPLSYQWRIVEEPFSGTTVLSSDTSPRAYFNASIAGSSARSGRYFIELTVSDGIASDTDTVVLTANENLPPLADAGPGARALVGIDSILDLDTVTDLEGGNVESVWSLIARPSSSATALSLPAGERPRLTADAPGDYVVQLTAADSDPLSPPASDTVLVSTQNTPPLASAGPIQTLSTGSFVQLDAGASSDVDEDTLTYSWALISKPLGSSAVLSDFNAVRPTFTADLDGVYVAQVSVHDGTEASVPSTVFIAASDLVIDTPDEFHYLDPVADAGADRTVAVGTLAQLDGGGSFYPNNIWNSSELLAFDWSILSSPGGSTAALSDPAAVSPTFTPDQPGIYVVQLAVQTVSPSVRVLDTVTISTTNSRPVADAGLEPDAATAPLIQLDGTSSADADGTALTFRWSVIHKPAGAAATLSDSSAASPTLSVDITGTYVAQLIVSDGALDSRPDTVVIEVNNTRPVADAGPDQSVVSGDDAQLDGTGSSDAENDPLTYAWSLVSVPAGSTAALDNPSAAMPTFTADQLGTYVAELVVHDGLAPSLPNQVTITATNAPPVLNPIGDRTVNLGSTLTLALSGSDLNGDPLSFTAQSMPPGASLNATTGQFTFRPDAGQAGTFIVTFFVSDGQFSASEAITVTVVGAAPGGVTALSGRVLDAVAAASGQTVPVQGATVSLAGSSVTATSDANGDFSLSGIADGAQVVTIDTQGALAAPDGSPYASSQEDIDLIAAVTNERAEAFFLARVDQSSATPYDPAATTATTVSNTALGVSLNVAAGSATLNGAPFNGTFTISDLPPAQAVSLAPELIAPCRIATIQPLGTLFNPLAQITLPNPDGLPAGTSVDIWSLDPVTGIFQITGTGQVTASGAQIVTVSGGVPAATAVFAVPRGPQVALAQDDNADNLRPSLLADGNLPTAISIPGATSLGQSRPLNFVYNSGSADPRPIVAAEIAFPAQAGLPSLLEGRLEVGGIDIAGDFFMSTSVPADPADPGLLPGETLRQGISFDADTLPSGSLPTRFVATSQYTCSRVGQAVAGEVLIDNQEDSPFGAGWTLAGLERLRIQDDAVVLEEGDGTLKRFARTTERYLDPIPFPAPGNGAFAVDDLDGDGNLDLAVPNFKDGPLRLMFGDGDSDFPVAFDLPSGLPIGSFPDTVSAATGDFNNDGIRDVAVVNQISNRFQLFIGRGNRTYDPPVAFGITRPNSIAVADFDLDGNQDVVLGTLEGGFSFHRVVFFFGDGAGGFPATARVNVGVNPNDVAVGDFNNDGIPDAAALSALNFQDRDELHILISNGARGFSLTDIAAGPVANQNASWKLAVGEFTGEGNLDAVVSPATRPEILLFRGNGAGGSAFRQAFPTGAALANSVQVADLDGDGKQDLLSADRNSPLVSILFGNGAGGFSQPTLLTVGTTGIKNALAGDFDKDGALDLFVGSGDTIYLVLADPTGFRPPEGEFSSLTENPDGTFTRRLTDGTTLTYDAQGRLTLRADRNGNTTAYAYNGAGLMTQIVNEPGTLVTTFAYVGGELATVTGPDGRVTTYETSAGRLAKVTLPDASQRTFAYDAQGRLTAETSPRGFTTTQSYGAAGRWLGAGLPDGSSVSAQISKSLGLADLGLGLGTPGNPLPYARPGVPESSFTDGNGNVTTVELNRFGSPVKIADALGRTTTLERDADDQVIRVTAPSDGELPGGSKPGTVVTELDYDSRGNVTAQREAVGTPLERQTLFEYEPVFNKVTRIVDPGGFETLFAYDANGNLTQTTDALLGTVVSTYDARGLKLTETDANNNPTAFVYDNNGNLGAITDALSNETVFQRDTAGRVTARTEGFGTPEARTTAFTYDAMDRVKTETDGAGGTTTFVYDASGNVTQEIDPTGIIVTRSYDERDRLTGEDDLASGLTQFAYDANDNVTSVTDALNAVTAFEYDAANRLTRSVDALGVPQLFAYDAQDDVASVTDALGQVTTFERDLLSRVIRRINPLTQTATLSYDSRDNLTGILDPKGQSIARTYDSLSRLTQIATPDNQIDLAYDAAGNVTAVTDSDSDLAFTYDALNRVETAATGAGGLQPLVTLTNTFDAVGNRVALDDDVGPSGGTTGYAYDLAGRLTSLTTPASAVINLGYDAADRPAGIAFPNGVSTGATYDSFGRLGSLAHTRAGTDLARFDYGYNALGSITQIAELTKTRDFTYDALLRLTAGGTAAAPESYTYDAEGNRTASHLSAGHLYDAANRLLEDDTFSYGYDANGNLTSKTDRTTLAVTTYTWDAQDRLTRIDFPDTTFATYAYNGLGRRIEKDVNGAVTRYVYDGEDILLEYDGAGALQARYTHGQRTDQPLAIERGATLAYFQADHLGSIRQVTDAAGTVVNAYDYDSYGNFEAPPTETLAQPYAFTGREFDAESGLLYYRARYYDPVTGRFISEDPIGFGAGDTNLYRYVFSDPVNLVDPSGLLAGDAVLRGQRSAGATKESSLLRIPVLCAYGFAASGLAIAANIAIGALPSNVDITFLPCAIMPDVVLSSGNGGSGSGSGDDASSGSGSGGGNPVAGSGSGGGSEGGSGTGTGTGASSPGSPDPDFDKQKKGRPRSNVAQNKKARDAANRAGLNREQRGKLKQELETLSRQHGENLDFQEILDLANDIKAGNL